MVNVTASQRFAILTIAGALQKDAAPKMINILSQLPRPKPLQAMRNPTVAGQPVSSRGMMTSPGRQPIRLLNPPSTSYKPPVPLPAVKPSAGSLPGLPPRPSGPPAPPPPSPVIKPQQSAYKPVAPGKQPWWKSPAALALGGAGTATGIGTGIVAMSGSGKPAAPATAPAAGATPAGATPPAATPPATNPATGGIRKEEMPADPNAEPVQEPAEAGTPADPAGQTQQPNTPTTARELQADPLLDPIGGMLPTSWKPTFDNLRKTYGNMGVTLGGGMGLLGLLLLLRNLFGKSGAAMPVRIPLKRAAGGKFSAKNSWLEKMKMPETGRTGCCDTNKRM